MTREDIIDKVRAAIDELSPFGSNELNPALDLVDKTLNDSTNTVLQFLPLYLLTPTPITTVGNITGESFTIGSSLGVPIQLANNDLINTVTPYVRDTVGTIFTIGTDYTIDYVNGKITPLSSGAMEATYSYLIDYSYNQNPGVPTPNPNDNQIGYINLPNDYIRLHSFKMSEWDTEVSQTFSPQSPVYKLQNNIYTRGGAHKPIVIVKSGAGGLTLYYYSVPKGTHVMETGLYIKKDIPDNLDNSIVPFIVWQTAFDVFISIGEIEKANAAKSKLGELITLKTI